jgi:hypothetical protein
MESELYATHAAIKGAAPSSGLLGEIGLHDGSATSIAVDNVSSKVVLQGEHAEKNSTGIRSSTSTGVMSTHQLVAAEIYDLDWVASANNPADIGTTFKSKTEYVRLRNMIMGYVFPPSISQMLRDTEEPTHWSKKLKKTKTKVKTTPLPASSAGKVE